MCSTDSLTGRNAKTGQHVLNEGCERTKEGRIASQNKLSNKGHTLEEQAGVNDGGTSFQKTFLPLANLSLSLSL